MASARIGPLRYLGPEANRWHVMSLSLTLMQTPTSIALRHAATAKSVKYYSHFRTICH